MNEFDIRSNSAGSYDVFDGSAWVPLAQFVQEHAASLRQMGFVNAGPKAVGGGMPVLYFYLPDGRGVPAYKLLDLPSRPAGWVGPWPPLIDSEYNPTALDIDWAAVRSVMPSQRSGSYGSRAEAMEAASTTPGLAGFVPAYDQRDGTWYLEAPEPDPLAQPETFTDPRSGVEYVRATPGGAWQVSYDPRMTPYQEAQVKLAQKPRNIDDLITDALVKATDEDLDRAQAYWEFRNAPTSLERFNAAMQYATAPGDQLTLTMMARGELPRQARPGFYDRVVDPAPFMQDAALAVLDPNRPFSRLRAQAQKAAQKPAVAGPNKPFSAALVTPEAAEGLPVTSTQAPVQTAPVAQGPFNRNAPAATASSQTWVLPAAVASGADSEEAGTFMPGGGKPFDVNSYNPQLSNDEYFRKLREAIPPDPDPDAGQDTATTLSLSTPGTYFDRNKPKRKTIGGVQTSIPGVKAFAQGGIAGLNGPELALLGENGPEEVKPITPPTSSFFSRAPQTTSPIMGPTSLPFSARRVGLEGAALDRPRSLPSLGALGFRSRQAQRNMTVPEHGFFRRAIEQQGVPWGYYADEEAEATSIGTPRHRQAYFDARRVGYR